jgi:hypothetical protein
MGVDYDLVERAIERKLDARGIRQPTVRKLELDPETSESAHEHLTAKTPAVANADDIPWADDDVADAASNQILWANDSIPAIKPNGVPWSNGAVPSSASNDVPWPDGNVIADDASLNLVKPAQPFRRLEADDQEPEQWPETTGQTMWSVVQEVASDTSDDDSAAASAPASSRSPWWGSSAEGTDDSRLMSKKSTSGFTGLPPVLTKGERRRERARDKREMIGYAAERNMTSEPLLARRVGTPGPEKKTDDELRNEKEKLRESILKLLGRL